MNVQLPSSASEEAFVALESRILIDPLNIDEELVSQVNDYYHASKGYDLIASLRDDAFESVGVLESNLSISIRRSFSQRGDKITEDFIKAMVKTDPGRVSSYDNYLDLRYLAERWRSLRDSIEKKGKALENIIKLYQVNYFGEHSISMSERKSANDRINRRVVG